MKEQRYGTLKGLKVAVNVYESYDEADQAAGAVNAALDQANDNLAYRGPLSEGRELLCELLEKETGIVRETTPSGKKDAQGNDILTYKHSEGEYAGIVCAQLKLDDLTQFQVKFDEAVAASNEGKGLSVDIKAKERKAPKAVKLAQKYKDSAKQVLDGGKVDAFNQKFGVKIGKTFTVTGDSAKDVEGLGYLIKEYAVWKEAQDALAMQAELAA